MLSLSLNTSTLAWEGWWRMMRVNLVQLSHFPAALCWWHRGGNTFFREGREQQDGQLAQAFSNQIKRTEIFAVVELKLKRLELNLWKTELFISGLLTWSWGLDSICSNLSLQTFKLSMQSPLQSQNNAWLQLHPLGSLCLPPLTVVILSVWLGLLTQASWNSGQTVHQIHPWADWIFL